MFIIDAIICASVSYPFAIRYLSFCDPILYLSFLGFQLKLPVGCDFQDVFQLHGSLTILRINR